VQSRGRDINDRRKCRWFFKENHSRKAPTELEIAEREHRKQFNGGWTKGGQVKQGVGGFEKTRRFPVGRHGRLSILFNVRLNNERGG